jgi:hypothetical protein
MTPYPRIHSFDIDPARFSAMIEELAYSETEEKKMASDYEDMEQESRLYPWIDDESYDVLNTEWEDFYREPSEYDEWQDYMGGDDNFSDYEIGEEW